MQFSYQDDCFTQLLATRSLEEILKDYSFEQLAYIGFEQDKELKNFQAFHEQATYQRALIAQTFRSQQRLLTASPIATLQSLAASLTTYDHPWAYYNQLLMTFCTFFQSDVRFYEHPEQQIQESFCKNTLEIQDWPFLSALFVLSAIYYHNHSQIFRQLAIEHQMDLSSFVSAYCGFFSPQRQTSFSHLIGLMLYTDYDDLYRLKIFETSFQSYPSYKKLTVLEQSIAHWAHKLTQELSLSSPRLKPVFDKNTMIKKILQDKYHKTLHPLFDFFVLLSALGASQSEISVVECFCALPQAISQFRFEKNSQLPQEEESV